MPSRALGIWRSRRSAALDELETARQAVTRAVHRGRRYATQQIIQSAAVMLSSQFQGFCRELHDEALDHLVRSLPAAAQAVVLRRFTEGRSLDRGNPNPGNLGADFRRFDLDLWPDVIALDASNAGRQRQIQELSTWRNAIAHQDFDPTTLGGRTQIWIADADAGGERATRLHGHSMRSSRTLWPA